VEANVPEHAVIEFDWERHIADAARAGAGFSLSGSKRWSR